MIMNISEVIESRPRWIWGELKLLEATINQCIEDLTIPEYRDSVFSWINSPDGPEEEWSFAWVAHVLNVNIKKLRDYILKERINET